MKFPNRKTVKELRKKYPKGTRVKLLKMDDPQAPPRDKGGSLNVIYGIDECKRVFPFKVICYGQEEIWYSREKAMEFYRNAIVNTEGNEQNRYIIIYNKIASGFDICSDELD